MSDNGSSPLTRDALRDLMKEVRDEATAEPIQAVDVPLTVEQRVQKCQVAIQVALDLYKCALQPSWEMVTPNQQIRSSSIQIVANVEAQ